MIKTWLKVVTKDHKVKQMEATHNKGKNNLAV